MHPKSQNSESITPKIRTLRVLHSRRKHIKLDFRLLGDARCTRSKAFYGPIKQGRVVTKHMRRAKGRRRRQKQIRELYYITHINNIPSILSKGIFSHERIDEENINYAEIYDSDIVSERKDIKVSEDKSLWSFANLYFNPRNPMLFRVICERPVNNIAVLGVDRSILNREDGYITTGNAAYKQTKILPIKKARKRLTKIFSETDRVYWRENDGSKRKIMAECLVPDSIHPDYIKSIYAPNHTTRLKVQELLQTVSASNGLPVISQPGMFFQPSREIPITDLLSVLEGDMFFSRRHTLTISVNTVGVMGKGVASRAKWQFPDVYVRYQYLCRNRTLRMGRPHLYKRETSFDLEFADDPSTLKNANLETWFLLFPTKTDWRLKADIKGIEEGLQWLCRNYKKDGIESLAIPALGCGLGRLNWIDVGPLLCKYLSTMDIPVSIYLPTERKVSDELLSKDFLLSTRDSLEKFIET